MGGRESKYQQLDLESCMAATGETEGNKTWRDCQWVEWDQGSEAHVSECKTTWATEHWSPTQLAERAWGMDICRGETCWGGHEGNGLEQKLEQDCSLMGSYVQLPATGETGIQGQLWNRPRVCAQLLDPPCTCLYSYTIPLLDTCPAQPEGGSAAGAVFVQLLCVSGCAAALDVCVVHTCALWGCWLGMCWALLLLGPGTMQLWQPHWAATSGLIALVLPSQKHSKSSTLFALSGFTQSRAWLLISSTYHLETQIA